jgi:hypothetical protein
VRKRVRDRWSVEKWVVGEKVGHMSFERARWTERKARTRIHSVDSDAKDRRQQGGRRDGGTCWFVRRLELDEVYHHFYLGWVQDGGEEGAPHRQGALLIDGLKVQV